MPHTAHKSYDDDCWKEQNRVMRKALDFDIHPSIRKALANRDGKGRIAEVSLGPERTEFRDVSASCTRVHVADIISHDTVSAEDLGLFDVVAVRLLHTSLRGSEWDRAIESFTALLRPGGWIQWVDWDPLTARVAGVKPGCSDAVLRDVLQRSRDTLLLQKVGSTYRIPAALQAGGFLEADSDLYPLIPDVPFTKAVANEAVTVFDNSTLMTDAEAEQLRLQVNEEIDANGPLLWYDLWCHIARKPGGS